MLAEIAAANAAFAVLKTAIQNGREIADVASSVGKYVNATEEARKKANKLKGSNDPSVLESFMRLEKLKQQEDELKQWMIYAGRPGLWQDWQRYQAEARKARLKAIEDRERKIKQILELTGISFLIVISFTLLGVWAMYLKSL